MQDELAVSSDGRRQNERVASVVAATETYDVVGVSGQVVDDFALAFVTLVRQFMHGKP